MDKVQEKWAKVEIPTSTGKDKEDEAKIAAARKAIIKVVNWDLNDDKHRKTEHIKDTVTYLRKILENVRDNPTEEKFRKVSIDHTNS
jgi:PUB domain